MKSTAMALPRLAFMSASLMFTSGRQGVANSGGEYQIAPTIIFAMAATSTAQKLIGISFMASPFAASFVSADAPACNQRPRIGEKCEALSRCPHQEVQRALENI